MNDFGASFAPYLNRFSDSISGFTQSDSSYDTQEGVYPGETGKGENRRGYQGRDEAYRLSEQGDHGTEQSTHLKGGRYGTQETKGTLESAS